jgi:hypothetical protein
MEAAADWIAGVCGASISIVAINERMAARAVRIADVIGAGVGVVASGAR